MSQSTRGAKTDEQCKPNTGSTWSNVQKFANASTRRILLLSTKCEHVSAIVKQRRISVTFAFPLSNSHNPRVHFDT